MPLRRTAPLRYSPQGLSDTLDATDEFQGAMGSLQNLIPDPTTLNIWQCRPASVELTDFTGFTNPGFISASKVVGSYVYGMIASDLNPGYDEPFAFNIVTGMFTAITGITGANVPSSPSPTGAWTPPTMEVVGVKVVITHPGYNPAGGLYFGTIDISNPAAPVYAAGNTAPVALPAVPTAVSQFNGRAWFLVNPTTGQPAAYFSDALLPNTITNANQILTFGDNVRLTMAAGLPLHTQTGGIIQSLIVFKGTTNMFQVTGDYSSSDLASNALNVATGTDAPLSVCPSPKGLYFMAPDGFRLIDFNAQVSDPVGIAGTGITVPFIYANVPSRVAAAYNSGVLRASVQNNAVSGSPNQEFWFHDTRNRWSGPHSFPAGQVQAYKNTFILAAIGVDAKLWQSDPAQSIASTFIENGAQMTFGFQTAMLPDPGQMSEMELTETTISIGFVSGLPALTITANDENGAILDTVSLTISGTATQWGAFTWGAAVWQGASFGLTPRQIKWTTPIVFRRLNLRMIGNCAAGVRVGDIFMRYRILGYLQQGN